MLLSFTYITNDNGHAIGDLGISKLLQIPTLKHLYLTKSAFGLESALMILDENKLETLQLGQYYDAISYKTLTTLAKSKSLKKLVLSSSHIDDKGALCLKNITSLRSLDVSFNKITDEGAIELAKMPLEYLNIEINNLMGPAGVKAVYESNIPKIKM